MAVGVANSWYARWGPINQDEDSKVMGSDFERPKPLKTFCVFFLMTIGVANSWYAHWGPTNPNKDSKVKGSDFKRPKPLRNFCDTINVSLHSYVFHTFNPRRKAHDSAIFIKAFLLRWSKFERKESIFHSNLKGVNGHTNQNSLILTSSSCRATSMDISDPLSPLLPIIHRLWQVFRVTSCVLT